MSTDSVQHHRLGPSKADRWVNCNASISFEDYLLEKGLIKPEPEEDPMSPSAVGTRVHLILSTALDNGVLAEDARHMLPPEEFERTTEEDADNAQVLINFVADYMEENPETELLVETKVDNEQFTGTKETGGTADVILINKPGREIVVMDYKNGSGVAVYPDQTHQLPLYGLGALEGHDVDDFDTVVLGICQPNHHATKNIELYPVPVEDLIEVAELYHKCAEIALDPEAYTNPATFQPGEKQCKWCPCVPYCEALASYMVGMAVEEFDIKNPEPVDEHDLIGVVTPEARAFFQTHIDLFKHWLNNISVNNTNYMLEGGTIPGFKLVRKSTKRVLVETNPKVIARKLNAKIGDITEQKLLPMTKIEKVAKDNGKVDVFNTFVMKPEGDLTIAPQADRREAVEADLPDEDNEAAMVAALLS